MASRRSRSARSAATKATVNISTAALRERSPPTNTAALLEDALEPIGDKEQEDWRAWVEIESEPAFFNGLLRDLGVQDVKIVEMFSVSMDDVQMLPQPVLGFVFLCRYAGEKTQESSEVPDSLWFANQTMDNGCATVALLNILMNAPTVALGEPLTAFKATTLPLCPPKRGWLLESNRPMRHAHNSYARRLELLNADLLISNDFDTCDGDADRAFNNKRRKLSAARKKGPGAAADGHNACHYKAFVPIDGQVWVLDGLESHPVSLGPATDETWIPIALQGIVDKMAVAGDMVNILAVCQAPTVALRDELLVNIHTLSALRESVPESVRPAKVKGRVYADSDDLDATLAQFGVSRAQLEAVSARCGADAAADTIASLEVEQRRIQSEYMHELNLVAREEELCSNRKRVYGPAVHKWAKALAKRGRLQELVGE